MVPGISHLFGLWSEIATTLVRENAHQSNELEQVYRSTKNQINPVPEAMKSDIVLGGIHEHDISPGAPVCQRRIKPFDVFLCLSRLEEIVNVGALGKRNCRAESNR